MILTPQRSLFFLALMAQQFSAASGSPVAVGIAPCSVATGDFSRYGVPDFAAANGTSNTISIWLSNPVAGQRGGWVFARSGGGVATGGLGPYSIALGDFNLDGKLDLVTANTVSNNVTVLLGNGAGGLAAAQGSPFATGTLPYGVAVGGFNGDGKPDLLVSNATDRTVSVRVGMEQVPLAAALSRSVREPMAWRLVISTTTASSISPLH